jgi:hypothetical protein
VSVSHPALGATEMTVITATVQTHRRSLAVVGAIVAIALAVVAVVLSKTSPGQGMHHLVSTYHHLPHVVQALLGGQHLRA